VEALALVLCDLAPSQRQEIAAAFLESSDAADGIAGGGLFVALRGQQLCGAAWGQPQPGNSAVFWPPQLSPGETDETTHQLARSVVAELDRAGVAMAQAVLPTGDVEHVAVITRVDFRHLADLLYLSWEASQIAAPPRPAVELAFIPYEASQLARFGALIERTYEGSLDCPALNGARRIDEVIAGYRATGVFRAENWLIVQHAGQDIGVLILADHPRARHWELVYMGLVPEARGNGWGRQIAQHAQWRAERAQVERIVLAVDSSNERALRMYRSTGFQSWDRRSVYVRFCR
jgi:ribosomal protein S18 acetylase RimI-like enzyme